MDKTEEMKTYDALQLLAAEKEIPIELLMEKIKAAILNAVKKNYSKSDNITIEFDEKKDEFDVTIHKVVADEITDPDNEITKDEAAKYTRKKVQAGDVVGIKLDTRKFGRIAAQNAKGIIKQGIKEVEREQLVAQWGDFEKEVVTVTVLKIEPRTGNAVVDLNGNEVMLMAHDMIPGEVIKVGDMIKVYVSGVSKSDHRPMLKISRTNKEMIKRLFEKEVPEIHDGIVEIMEVSREPGSRSKVAVISHNPDVDALGACIGPGRQRISKVCEQINGEKIDVVFYSEDPAEFIKQALKPSDVISVEIHDGEQKSCTAIVPDNQLSLAIGNKGQNAKLAAKLTRYKIDIRPESGFFEGIEKKQSKEEEPTEDNQAAEASDGE